MMILQNMMCILVIYYWSSKSAQTEWSIHPAKLVINSITDDLGPPTDCFMDNPGFPGVKFGSQVLYGKPW